MNTRYWKGRVKALFSFTFANETTSHLNNNNQIPGNKAKASKSARFIKDCKAFFQRSSRSRSKNSCCRCRQRHPPLPPSTPEPTIPYRSESRTLTMANSVRMAGRVLDSLQEQRQLMSRKNHTQTSSLFPALEDVDSGSDLSALPPRTPYRMLDGPDIENIEAYVQGFYESNEHDYEVANTTLGRSTLASRRTPYSRALLRLPLTGVSLASSSAMSASSPVYSPITRCKTSRGNSAAFPTGQSTPTTPTSVFSMALRSPCSTLSRQFSARVGVAPMRSMDLGKSQNSHDGSSSSHSTDMIHQGSRDLKEEYISEDETNKGRQVLHGYQGRIRRSRSKLQRLDHGEIETEIRSPNGLANTPKTTTFRNWDRTLSSGGQGQGQGQGGTRASPQEKMPRPRRHHPMEIRLDQTDVAMQQLKTCVEDRVALEDRFRRMDRRLREHEEGARDWEAKYLEMCRGMAQAQATF
ncbi:hypothetical protein BGZ82_006097 [Podila clonocystis]|nr:hypothetical protein BGZ82_006097 [Podila clonocystis]